MARIGALEAVWWSPYLASRSRESAVSLQFGARPGCNPYPLPRI